METATDKIELFAPDDIAELIGGNTKHVLMALKACHGKCSSTAFQWLMLGDRSKRWPLADQDSRGTTLIDQLSEDLCDEMNRVVTTSPWVEHVLTQEATVKTIQQHFLARREFDRLRFRRGEIARWLQAFGLKSEYSFSGTGGEGVVAVREDVADRDARRLAEFEAFGGLLAYENGEWSVANRGGALKNLAKKERAAGVKPFDPKMIRIGIVRAAEKRREGAREGCATFATGLGARKA